MTAKNKLLIGMTAIVAFVIGIALNTRHISDNIDTQTLLSAKLDQNGSAATIQNYLGKLTLINFWASWCSPCAEEMPIFEAMYRQANQNGFQVIGVAIDNPDKAQPMLDSMDITYPILYAEFTGMQMMASASNPQGLLPYSLLLDSNGNVIEQILGTINEQQIAHWLTAYL